MPTLVVAGAVGTAIIALLLGLRIGKRYARLSLCGSLALTTLCFVAYTVFTNLSRTTYQLSSFHALRDLTIGGSWLGLLFAGGLFGPAAVKRGATAVFLSVAGTVAIVMVGGIVLFALACMFASQCL